MSVSSMPQDSRRSAWIPWAFVIFFVVIFAMNGTLIWLATHSWTGLSTEQAYEKGLRYNENLQAARHQAALGWQPRLSVQVVEGFQAEAVVEIRDAQGAPLTDVDMQAVFQRPTRSGTDFTVPLTASSPGRYHAQFTLPMVGVWDVHLTIRRGEDLFVLDERVMLR